MDLSQIGIMVAYDQQTAYQLLLGVSLLLEAYNYLKLVTFECLFSGLLAALLHKPDLLPIAGIISHISQRYWIAALSRQF